MFCGPRGLPYETIQIFKNLNGRRFVDVTRTALGTQIPPIYPFTTVAADFDNDGWTDVYVASDSTASLLLRNLRNGTFEEVGIQAGVAYNEHGYEQSGMGVAVNDFNNDGLVDIVKTNFVNDYPNLYRNLGGGLFEDAVYELGLGVNPFYVGWGVVMEDFDNDGWTDILQVNGHVYPEIDRLKTAETYRNPRLVYRNLESHPFEDVSHLAGPGISDNHSSRGAAVGDIDNDGDPDVLIMNMGETPSLLLNQLSNKKHWVRVKLVGTRSNKIAIGALVLVKTPSGMLVRPVQSQSSFLSQTSFKLHFGRKICRTVAGRRC